MSTTPAPAPRRRRIVLMRHGAVSYFDEESGRTLDPEQVPLNETGRRQAEAAGRALAREGLRFDRVIVSGLPRTVQTADRVLFSSGQVGMRLRGEPQWQEIRPGRLADLDEAALQRQVRELQQGRLDEALQFFGGERIGELLDRVLPPLARLRADPHWDCALLVLHGVVNAALLSHAISGGQRQIFGSLLQSPAGISVLDVGEAEGDWLLRTLNHVPEHPLQAQDRLSVLEQLMLQYRAARERAAAQA